MSYPERCFAEMYGYVSPIDRKLVLDKLTQEDIFSYILKSDIDLDRLYCAPYRADMNPGCKFRWHNGTLFFCDFANVGDTHFNCFQLYKKTYNVPDCFLYEHIYNNVDATGYGCLGVVMSKGNKRKGDRRDTVITILEKPYSMQELSWWDKYGITLKQLESDNVKSLKAFMIETGDRCYSTIVNNIGFAYTEFENDRKKIYQPLNAKTDKWFTNCSANDIGNIRNLAMSGQNLIVTKSYKDCRVLRNLGFDTIWFQNEGMCPEKKMLKMLSERFENIFVFFDNDSSGLKASSIIREKFNEFTENCHSFCLPVKLLEHKIKDASDFVENINYYELKKYILTKL